MAALEGLRGFETFSGRGLAEDDMGLDGPALGIGEGRESPEKVTSAGFGDSPSK